MPYDPDSDSSPEDEKALAHFIFPTPQLPPQEPRAAAPGIIILQDELRLRRRAPATES